LLASTRDALDPGKFPVIQNTIRRLFIGAPGAVMAFEKTHGPVHQ
jgi:hypothetical protein